MAKAAPERIVISSGNLNGVVRREALSSAVVTPGELLDFSAGLLIPHGGAAGVLGGKLVCLETQTPDNGTTPSMSVDYSAGDTVYYAEGVPGDVFYMWLSATDTTVAGTTQLVSDGAGALQPETVDATTLANSVVGVAEDSTTAGTTRVRIRVRIT
jgi:hypothetical protein